MPQTFDLIQTQILSSNQATVSFNSFSGYTDLVIVGQWCPATTGGANDFYMRFNGVGSNQYIAQQLVADGTSVVANDTGFTNGLRVANQADSSAADKFSAFEINIYNYSGTSFGKPVYSRWVGASAQPSSGMFGGWWDNTAAITSIEIQTLTSTQIKAGSVFSLYGILRA
jgi:hypothetical protein